MMNPAIRAATLMWLVVLVADRPLSGQTRSAAAAQAPPPGWSDAEQTRRALILDGKNRELVAMCEKWVAKYPDFADAHMCLGGAYEDLARPMIGSRTPGAFVERDKLFEAAAAQFRRAFDLGGGS